MATTPPIPTEQRSFADDVQGGDPAARLNSAHPERRDQATGVQSADPGDADVDLSKEGRFGNLEQNLTPQLKTQDR